MDSVLDHNHLHQSQGVGDLHINSDWQPRTASVLHAREVRSTYWINTILIWFADEQDRSSPETGADVAVTTTSTCESPPPICVCTLVREQQEGRIGSKDAQERPKSNRVRNCDFMCTPLQK